MIKDNKWGTDMEDISGCIKSGDDLIRMAQKQKHDATDRCNTVYTKQSSHVPLVKENL